MTTQTSQGSSTASPTPDDLLKRHVAARVIRLQQGYLGDQPGAVASLARLRRAVSSEPGTDPDVWFDLFDAFPNALLGRGDAPSSSERAAHAAITIFAVHQQSRTEPMHRAGVSLGSAVRVLGQETSSEDAVLRRFHALGTASSLPETLHHLRGLASQLRAAAIGLDYGQLGVDLRRLQSPRTAGGVRLRWGRAYYRSHAATGATESSASKSTQTPGE